MRRIKIVEYNHDQFEILVPTEKELSEELYRLPKIEARVVIMEIPDIGIFTLGIGLPYGFLQFSKDGEPPYLVAVADEFPLGIDPSEEVEFNAGGTPTPIAIGQCLPYKRIVEIMMYCFKNKELPRSIKWEEI